MSERKQVLKDKLFASRARLNAVLDQVGERWESQVYSDGAAWNVRQLVIHLLNSETGMMSQAKSIAEGGEGVPADFDLERYNRRSVEKKAEVTAQEARDGLTAARADLLGWLDGVDEEKLDNKGRHASLNIFSVEQFVRIIASHEREHTNDIARVLEIQV
jgi:hypothetical protein